ncbi:hypothetical protein B7760_04927 [Burkholderia glumae]|nr:hypothetical protein B7760_04927 [Burkholderia glumae]
MIAPTRPAAASSTARAAAAWLCGTSSSGQREASMPASAATRASRARGATISGASSPPRGES